MTKCYHHSIEFSSLKRRKVSVTFEGGEITSDGGVLLLREIDKQTGLTEAINKAFKDTRHQSYCTHSQLTLIRQRIFGLALGYEDLNDHDHLRHDGAIQTASGKLGTLGSSPTLCRLEQRADKHSAFALHAVMVDQFIESYTHPPKKLVLDFDATHDPVHGEQEGRHFNAFYDTYCFLPLYVFCGNRMLTSYLRPSSCGAAHHAGAVLKLLVERLRKVWPKVKIVFRADAGFCKPLILNWCDRHGVDYVVGLSKNSVLTRKSEVIRALSESMYRLEEKAQKRFTEFRYSARSWPHKRRIIVKSEFNSLGENTRYVVTSLSSRPKTLYEVDYCQRGDMENRIKEQKSLFSDRTSCHDWWPNQLRLLFTSFSYMLIEALRRNCLHETELACAQVRTVQLELFKIGGIITRNTRSIKLMLSSNYPYQYLFSKVADTLNSG